MLAVAPGIAAWGLMTGVAMVKSGMSTVEALFMALIVFAGSSLLAAIPLILVGAPMWVILATGLCVNLRFVVFSAHLRPYVMHLPLWQRLLTGYLTADLTYVLFVKRYARPGVDAPARLAQMAYLAGQLHSDAVGAGLCRDSGAAGHAVLAGIEQAALGVRHGGRGGGCCGVCTAVKTQYSGGHCRRRGLLPAAGEPYAGFWRSSG